MYIQPKIKLWTIVLCTHLLHSCVLVCFLRLICIFVLFVSSVLESQSDDWESPAFFVRSFVRSFVRFEGRTFVVVNGTFPLKVWRFPWKNAAGPAWRNSQLSWEGRENKMADERKSTVAPSSLTHMFVLKINFLFSTVLFQSTFSSFVFVFVFRFL
jgi:hypothetical protein